jgi:hypothetical protein
MLLFSAFQALMVGLKCATVVAKSEQHNHSPFEQPLPIRGISMESCK